MTAVANSNPIDRFLDSLADCLPPAVAAQIASIPLDAAAGERLETLRTKANEGQLSARERTEYEELVDALDLVALIKLKARQKSAQNGS